MISPRKWGEGHFLSKATAASVLKTEKTKICRPILLFFDIQKQISDEGDNVCSKF